jgi:allantoinase
MGETLRGSVRSTWLRGQPIFSRTESRDTFPAPPQGREYTLSCSLKP